MVLVFFYNHIQITSASIIPSLFFPSSHIHMVPPLSVWFRFVWTFVAISPHKSQVKDLWDMAAICFILHDLQPVFLVKSVKATLLFNILSDPFTSTEQICLNWQENPVTCCQAFSVTPHLHWRDRWHVVPWRLLFTNQSNQLSFSMEIILYKNICFSLSYFLSETLYLPEVI